MQQSQQENTNRRILAALWVLLALGVAAILYLALNRGGDGTPNNAQNVNHTPTPAGAARVTAAPTLAGRTAQALPVTAVAPITPTIALPTPEPPTPEPPSATPVPPSPTTPPPPATPTLAPTLPPTVAVQPTAAGGAQPGQPRPSATQPPGALPRGGVPVTTPTKKPQPGVQILPNGVRYGDRRPNLPNRIVRLTSPNIPLDTPVYEVYSPKGKWEVADYAAGHHYNSLNPGEGGNIVLAGHNNWRGEVFRYLETMKPGNEVWAHTLEGKVYKYRVEQVFKLKEAGVSLQQRLENGKVMNPTPHEQLTLITCWPYTTYTHRLIVTAVPME